MSNHLFHTVIHRQQSLHPPALKHVGELHVDRLHGSCVTEDPMLVWVWGVVVAGGSPEVKKKCSLKRSFALLLLCLKVHIKSRKMFG